jgi:hypothetical protein
MNSISPRERRDYVNYFQHRDEVTRERNVVLIIMFVLILFGASLLIHLFVEPVVIPTKANAEDSLDYRDVHTEAQLKVWMSQHSSKVVTRYGV